LPEHLDEFGSLDAPFGIQGGWPAFTCPSDNGPGLGVLKSRLGGVIAKAVIAAHLIWSDVPEDRFHRTTKFNVERRATS
jgi:hypothetical protein